MPRARIELKQDFINFDVYQARFANLSENLDEELETEYANTVIDRVQQTLNRNYSRSGGRMPIEASGVLGNEIYEDTWYTDILDGQLVISWEPNAEAVDSNDGQTWGKLFHIDAGSGQQGSSSDLASPQDMNFGYTATTGQRIEWQNTPMKDGGGWNRGTGQKADFPSGRSWATRQSEGGTEMGEFRQAIKSWATSKGLDSVWFVIARNIAQEGMSPANPPFLVGNEGLFTDYSYSNPTSELWDILTDTLEQVVGDISQTIMASPRGSRVVSKSLGITFDYRASGGGRYRGAGGRFVSTKVGRGVE